MPAVSLLFTCMGYVVSMKVLVTASGRYGSTQQIAETIGEVLSEHGHDVDVIPAPEVSDVSEYEAVVMGGAVYAGQWLRDGRELIKRVGESLVDKSLWLFSSGPVGEDMPASPPPLMGEVLDPLDGEDHAVFGGRLQRDQLYIGDKAIAQSLGAEDGDYRNWDEIKAWASSVAAQISSRS